MAIVICTRCGAKNRVQERAAETLQPVCGKCGTELNSGGVTSATSSTGGSGADEGKPRTVTDANFPTQVLGVSGRPVLLDCWAEWCGPCRMIAPVLDQMAAESRGRYVIAKLNVDENPRTSAQFGIRSIPTMLIFKNGELVDRVVGAQPKQAILAKLNAHV